MTVVHFFFAEKPSVSMALAFCLWSPGYENLPTTKECCPSRSSEFFELILKFM
jgi:hypothetical protein